ncbi:glucosidase [Lichenihabitans sp. Uapishka_5]|uniref:MGH1-like glycoside hydrolase domain-containing protein n=1 Tax=Lichenihabitans sp. Uapishka_5 TaxID=3037302 RepID=UPI0029E7DF79|nr:glucosidase [Lichenihabitans sp. Uapishka_5]MDX7949823.1 glucosidase [Lichenihabitans sp. Uapishka_5]
MPAETSPPDPPSLLDTVEGRRLLASDQGWQRWGPYLSERQWGTVREDYSASGDAWDYLPHDHARSRAYRWGEDGIAGFSDDHQFWCLALALWNGQDPILKERMFGLTNAEGNHGEDVKELWWYQDGTPTHSYMRVLYKYPQAEFPYDDLVAENNRRKAHPQAEYELVDTGIFADNRYFDVTVEYAKAGTDDILMRVTVANRGPDPASLHVLPHLWARNTWSWSDRAARPSLKQCAPERILAERAGTGQRCFTALQPCDFLFCDNDTNTGRLFGQPRPGFFKDGINDAVTRGRTEAVNPARQGTKCAALVRLDVPAGASVTLRFRFAPTEAAVLDEAGFEAVLRDRIAEADAFYAALQADIPEPDARLVQRQALAGMLWSKQRYFFDVRRWLAGDPTQPAPPPEHRTIRNADWPYLDNADIISMPDKWEYPWYAAWDLAFHCVTFALIDPAFAKGQLILLTREWYMNPNGQLPAYEWNFSDVNPPVHAWATWRVYEMDRALTGVGDRAFLERVFHKLMLNFTWWVNRKDKDGRNIFQGGFLGLDNIGVFDRSKPLPTGGFLSQADGTGWMAMYALNLMRIALELARDNPVYEDIATKFFEHFLYIAEAMTTMGESGEASSGLWDEQDGFYYDMLNLPDGSRVPLRVRSLVGLIPICAVEVLDGDLEASCPNFVARLRWILAHRTDLAELVSRWEEPGQQNRLLLSLLRRQRMTALLRRMLDETEFLSDYGVRSVSKVHAAEPFVYENGGTRFIVDYEPAESATTLFGGNSNWRGPIWMPINVLLIEALYEFETFYPKDFTIECPTGSGAMLTLSEIADELARRVSNLFLRNGKGRRPVLGDEPLFQDDPHFRDQVPFHEYFHGDTGKGLGATHQTGWSGLVALLLQPRLRHGGKLMPVSPGSVPENGVQSAP